MTWKKRLNTDGEDDDRHEEICVEKGKGGGEERPAGRGYPIVIQWELTNTCGVGMAEQLE